MSMNATSTPTMSCRALCVFDHSRPFKLRGYIVREHESGVEIHFKAAGIGTGKNQRAANLCISDWRSSCTPWWRFWRFGDVVEWLESDGALKDAGRVPRRAPRLEWTLALDPKLPQCRRWDHPSTSWAVTDSLQVRPAMREKTTSSKDKVESVCTLLDDALCECVLMRGYAWVKLPHATYPALLDWPWGPAKRSPDK